MFGDWHLALAAYNWGEGSVGRAIARNRQKGLGTGYLDLPMPAETRLYVPKLQAIKNIVMQPQAFNSQLPAIGNHPYFASVPISRDIDVTLAAKLAQIPLDDFKALNPSANKPVILAAGKPYILLPWDNAEVFQNNLDGFAGARLASWTVWVVPQTMSVAAASKRSGMGEQQLRELNSIPPRMLIRAGSSLLVPRAAKLDQDVGTKVADNGQLSLTPEIVLLRTLIKAGKKDTVASIASRYKTTPANVAQWNSVSASAAFKPGQKVVVFLPASAAKKAGTARKVVAAKRAKKSG
jgi:membrane-bound lytic murein transglycosylase D